MEKITEKVLLVDDDRHQLETITQQVGQRINLQTATSGGDGLQAVTDAGPFAVIVSDLEMPNMDGLELLTKVRVRAPNTARILLADRFDQELLIDAINECNILRFYHKPVDPPRLYEAIIDGIQQYRATIADKVLLGKTLNGLVDLLSDLLKLANPNAAQRAEQSKQRMHHMLRHLGIEKGWPYELASKLYYLGHITLPPRLDEPPGQAQTPNAEPAVQIKNLPQTTSWLLRHIPQFASIADMIEQQEAPLDRLPLGDGLTPQQKVLLGGQMLRVVTAYEGLIREGTTADAAISSLQQQADAYNPALVHALAMGDRSEGRVELHELPVEKLEVGMVLNQAIRSKAGALLVARGHPIDSVIKLRLLVARETGIISGTFQVMTSA